MAEQRFLEDFAERLETDSTAACEWYANLLPIAILESKHCPAKELRPYSSQEIIESLSHALDLADIQDKSFRLENHVSTSILLNTVGACYPIVNRPLREELLWQCVSFLDSHFGTMTDGELKMTADDYVKFIDEPTLVRDLCMNRFMYFFDLESLESVADVQSSNSWKDYKRKVSTRCSEERLGIFASRYPLLLQKYSSSSIIDGFFSEEPILADNMTKAVAGFVYVSAFMGVERDNVPLEIGFLDAAAPYSSRIYSPMMAHIEKRDWILWPHKPQFN